VFFGVGEKVGNSLRKPPLYPLSYGGPISNFSVAILADASQVQKCPTRKQSSSGLAEPDVTR
jgi:hypothetical protein